MTDRAARDMEDCTMTLSARCAGQAEHVLEQIEKAFTSLSENPLRGDLPEGIAAIGLREYREIFFKPYRIIYRVMGEKSMFL